MSRVEAETAASMPPAEARREIIEVAGIVEAAVSRSGTTTTTLR